MRAVKAAAPADARTARGCLLLADMGGYTDYVVSSPLEHAEDVLSDLTAAVAERLGAVLRLNKLEGDAVFAYALEGELDGSMLLDAVEDAYAVFRGRLAGIGHATSCSCNACAKLPQLDLKFVAHVGSFVCRNGPGAEELTGRDVIVAHRLLKNDVVATLSLRGYALLTAACVDALALDPHALGLHPHVERHGDVGDVEAFVLDLEARWLANDERRRVRVTPAEAVFELETRLAAPPAVAWEYLTAPARRAEWQGAVTEESPGGRRGAGTTSYCVDGRRAVYEEILDWRPFEYFTERVTEGRLRLALTTQLSPDGDATIVSVLAGRPAGGRLAWLAARPRLVRRLRRSYARLATLSLSS